MPCLGMLPLQKKPPKTNKQNKQKKKPPKNGKSLKAMTYHALLQKSRRFVRAAKKPELKHPPALSKTYFSDHTDTEVDSHHQS